MEASRSELEDLALAALLIERGVANRAQAEALLGRRTGARRLLDAAPADWPGAARAAQLLPEARNRVRACPRCGRGLLVVAGPWSRACSYCPQPGETAALPAPAPAETLALEGRAAQDVISTLTEGKDAKSPARRFVAGDVVAGYTVERELGRGAMGAVLLARKPGEEAVALKVMVKAGTDELRRRFVREGQALARLSHPNIVAIRDVGEAGGVPFIAMEYVEGDTLSQLLKRGVGIERVLSIGEAIARAVHHAHESGVVHRDLKPQNVLVTPSGEVKIVDFGLAKDLTESAPLTRQGELLGTPYYMAPEAVRGAPELITTKVDIYAIGAILYELATYTLPFERASRDGIKALLRAITEETVEPPSKRRPDITFPRGFDEVVCSALDRRPERRQPTAGALADDLAHLRAPPPRTTLPLSPAAASGGRERFGEFEALTEIGRGGSGVVYRGLGPGGRAVAIKVLLGDPDEAAVARFDRERRLLGELGEEHGFVPLLASGTSARGTYVVMPFVEGGTLRDRFKNGPLPVEEALGILRAIAKAIGAAHARGIVHRDLKPDNVLFTGSRPLVADLGLAKHVKRSALGGSRSVSLTMTGEFRGTPGYMPAEQMFDVRDVTPATDVFALGAIAYECLTTQLPFQGASVLEIAGRVDEGRYVPLDGARPGLPRWLVAAVHKALSRNPESRFQDGAAFAEALAGPPPGEGLRRVLPVAAAGALAVVVAVGVALARSRPADPSVPSVPAVATVKTDAVGAPASAATAAVSFAAPPSYERALVTKRAKLAAIWGSPDGKHTADVVSVGVARDGEHVVSGGNDKMLRVWKVTPAARDRFTFREVSVIPGHTGSVMSLALQGSGDLERVLTGSVDGGLRLFELASKKEVASLSDEKVSVNSVALSSDGQRALAGGDDGVLRLWDVASKRIVRRFDARAGKIFAVALSADATWALSGHADGAVRVWDTIDASEPSHVLPGHTKPISQVAFAPDKKRGVSASEDGTVRVWDLGTGRLLASFGTPDQLAASVDFTPDGRRLVHAGQTGTLHVIDLESGREERVLEGHTDIVWQVVCRPDGKTVVSASRDATVRLWELATGRELSIRSGHDREIVSLAVSSDGTRAATGGVDGTARLWDVATGREVATLPALGRATVAFSPDGKKLLTLANEGVYELWDAATGANLTTITIVLTRPGATEDDRAPADLKTAAFLPDGQRFVLSDGAGHILLWDLATAKPAWVHTAGEEVIDTIVPSRDGALAFTASQDKQIGVFDLKTGAPLFKVEAHATPVLGLALSPDGKTLASSAVDNTIALIDLFTPRAPLEPPPSRILRGLPAHATSLAFSPDGRLLAASCSDGVVRLYDLAGADPKPIDELPLGLGEVATGVAFVPGRRDLLVATSRGVVLRFDVTDR